MRSSDTLRLRVGRRNERFAHDLDTSLNCLAAGSVCRHVCWSRPSYFCGPIFFRSASAAPPLRCRSLPLVARSSRSYSASLTKLSPGIASRTVCRLHISYVTSAYSRDALTSPYANWTVSRISHKLRDIVSGNMLHRPSAALRVGKPAAEPPVSVMILI